MLQAKGHFRAHGKFAYKPTDTFEHTARLLEPVDTPVRFRVWHSRVDHAHIHARLDVLITHTYMHDWSAACVCACAVCSPAFRSEERRRPVQAAVQGAQASAVQPCCFGGSAGEMFVHQSIRLIISYQSIRLIISIYRSVESTHHIYLLWGFRLSLIHQSIRLIISIYRSVESTYPRKSI